MKSKEELSNRYHELIRRLHVLIGKGCAAAVYTQTTDVEGEVNGLLTYDREVIKMDPALLSKWHAELNNPAPIEVTVLESSEKKAQTWRYTMSEPAKEWTQSGFDDKNWKEGAGGFGTEMTPNTNVRTKWDSPDIWIRREFELSEDIPSNATAMLQIFHDEEAQVFINGVEAAKVEGHTTAYNTVGISEAAAKSLKKGKNVIAIHCHQTSGGQYIDAALVQIRAAR